MAGKAKLGCPKNVRKREKQKNHNLSISFTIWSAPLHQPREDQHIKNGLSNVLPCYGDGGEAAVHGRAK